MALTRPGDYLGMLSSTVAHPYRKTMTPTREAGISICVYRPNQAKYRAIFSPKYFLNETKISNVLGLISSEHGQNERMLAWGGLLFSPHKSNGLVLEEHAVVGPLLIQKLRTIKGRQFKFRQ